MRSAPRRLTASCWATPADMLASSRASGPLWRRPPTRPAGAGPAPRGGVTRPRHLLRRATDAGGVRRRRRRRRSAPRGAPGAASRRPPATAAMPGPGRGRRGRERDQLVELRDHLVDQGLVRIVRVRLDVGWWRRGRRRRRGCRGASPPLAAGAAPGRRRRAPASAVRTGGATTPGRRGDTAPTLSQPLSWSFINCTRRSRTREQGQPGRHPGPDRGGTRRPPECARARPRDRSRSPRPASAGSCGCPSTRTAA